MSDSHWSDDDFYEGFTLPEDDDLSSNHGVDAVISERERNEDCNISQESSTFPEMVTTVQQESQFSDTDDIPLAYFATSYKTNKNMSRSPSPEFDDTDKDETYSPSTSPETSLSESESGDASDY